MKLFSREEVFALEKEVAAAKQLFEAEQKKYQEKIAAKKAPYEEARLAFNKKQEEHLAALTKARNWTTEPLQQVEGLVLYYDHLMLEDVRINLDESVSIQQSGLSAANASDKKILVVVTHGTEVNNLKVSAKQEEQLITLITQMSLLCKSKEALLEKNAQEIERLEKETEMLQAEQEQVSRLKQELNAAEADRDALNNAAVKYLSLKQSYVIAQQQSEMTKSHELKTKVWISRLCLGLYILFVLTCFSIALSDASGSGLGLIIIFSLICFAAYRIFSVQAKAQAQVTGAVAVIYPKEDKVQALYESLANKYLPNKAKTPEAPLKNKAVEEVVVTPVEPEVPEAPIDLKDLETAKTQAPKESEKPIDPRDQN